jgi:hypothetical protein
VAARRGRPRSRQSVLSAPSQQELQFCQVVRLQDPESVISASASSRTEGHDGDRSALTLAFGVISAGASSGTKDSGFSFTGVRDSGGHV